MHRQRMRGANAADGRFTKQRQSKQLHNASVIHNNKRELVQVDKRVRGESCCGILNIGLDLSCMLTQKGVNQGKW